MNHLYTRIVKRLKYTWTAFRSDSHFSIYYALLRILDEAGGRIGLRNASAKAHSKREQWILNYLTKQLKPLLDEMRDMDDAGECTDNAPIWVCWWTGEETAPPIVKRCIRSIRENAGEHPVHLITQENYREYLQVPDYMLKKVQKKQMGLAHLSDYIRSTLLAEQGGLWLDATIFCSQEISEEYFKFPVFTCKSPEQSCVYLSKMQWTTFVLGGWKGNVFYRYLKNAFEYYWEENNTAIDYLFFDYLIYIGKEYIPAIEVYLDAVPINNLRRDDLQAAMNAALPAEMFDTIVQDDTCLYKLSWRESYSEKTADGSESIYHYFIKNRSRS